MRHPLSAARAVDLRVAVLETGGHRLSSQFASAVWRTLGKTQPGLGAINFTDPGLGAAVSAPIGVSVDLSCVTIGGYLHGKFCRLASGITAVVQGDCADIEPTTLLGKPDVGWRTARLPRFFAQVRAVAG